VWLWQIPKNCTCLVLMLLLLVSMLTMSTRTTYILCICSKVSPTYTEDCLENCATKYIGHHVTSQWSAPTRTRKEILRVILSLIISTPKMDIWELGQPKQCSVCHIPGHSKKKKLLPPYRLKPTTLNLCHIYPLYFKHFILLLVILYIFCNLNILVQFNLLVTYFYLFQIDILIIK